MDIQKCMEDNQNKGFIALAAEKICGGIKRGIDKCVSAYMNSFGVKKYQAESFCEGVSGDITPWTDKSVDTASEYLRELTNAQELENEGLPWWGIMAICLGSAAVVTGLGVGTACCVKKQKSERNQSPHCVRIEMKKNVL